MSALHTNPYHITGHGLVLPDETQDGARALTTAYARYLAACCQRFLAINAELPAALRPAYHRIAALVRQASDRNQRQMLLCFASPTVSTPLQCLRLRDDVPAFQARIDSAAAAMLPHLVLEMGLRGLIPERESLLWEHGAPRLASLALAGELISPEGATGLRFSASHVAAIGSTAELARLPLDPEAMHAVLAKEAPGFRYERHFWRTGKVTRLATLDHNPIAEFEAHPEKAGNHIDLGGHSAEQWIGILDECFALVERFMPGEFAEMRMLLHEMIPVGYDDVRHLSASYREAVGTVYLTLHPNLMTMAEAIVHEFQHNKLNVAAHSVEFISNALAPLYASPIRPDPRPLWGILLAVHAFLPVAELYRRMRGGGHPWSALGEFEQRLLDIDRKNHEGMEMLRAHAQFTAPGQALFEELEKLERRHLAERSAEELENPAAEIHLA